MTKDKVLNYDAEQIKTLEGRDHVRKRPSMYIGSTANPNHLAIEVMANSIDEAINGYGDNIIFTLDKDKKGLRVRDYGRGIPVNTVREDGLTTLEASFSVLNTSGKFDQNAFQTSIGTNGIGGKAANFLSTLFEVSTIRDGKKEMLIFKEGILQDRKIESTTEKNGVMVYFRPDDTKFTTVEFDTKLLNETLKQASYLNRGVSFTFNDLSIDKETVYLSKNGLGDYVKELAQDSKLITSNDLYINHVEEGFGIEIAMSYSQSSNEIVKTFANTGYTPDNGTHLTAVRTCLTRQLNNYASEAKLFKDGEKNLTGKEYSEGLILVLNVNMPDMGYDSQAKTKVTDTRCAGLINPIMNEAIADWLRANPKSSKEIIEKALLSRRASEAAKKAREKITQPKKNNDLKARLQLATKLTDASERKNRKNCELMIVEGDSAGGSAKSARDPKVQAVLPIRGKSLNAQKATIERILANQEFVSIINAIGGDFGKNFDVSKSRYGKIIILTDADVDGAHIATLLLTFFYNQMRPLIENGMVYMATPPLYKAKIGQKTHYIADDEALEEFRASHNKFELGRFKGLGEMNPSELKDTTVSPSTRTLKQVTIEDAKSASDLIEVLMGKEVKPRKEFIFENAENIVIDL